MPAATMMATTGATAPASTGGGKTTTAAPTILLPFMRGAIDHSEPFYDTTFTLGVNTSNIGPIDIASYGFAKAIWCEIDIASSGNSATVALAEDAPWTALAEVAIQDVNGAPLFGPHGGFEAYLHHKYGGFRGQRDPKLYQDFAALTTGSGGTAGTGKMRFRMNLERNNRDGLGALANMNASQAYKLRGTVNALLGIYTTVPNGAVTARVRFWLEAYSQPGPYDAQGRPQAQFPPANETTGFSSRIQPPTVAGANTIRHNRVGNMIRNLLYINRRAGTSRANGETDLAGLNLQWYIDTRLMTNMSIEMIRSRMLEQFQLSATAFEAAGGPDNGVFVLPFCTELDGVAGYELRDMWLPTTQATRLEVTMTLPNSGVLTVMTDDVAPKGNVFTS